MADYGKVKCEYCLIECADYHLRCFTGPEDDGDFRIYCCALCLYRLIKLEQALFARGNVYYFARLTYNGRPDYVKGLALLCTTAEFLTENYPNIKIVNPGCPVCGLNSIVSPDKKEDPETEDEKMGYALL